MAKRARKPPDEIDKFVGNRVRIARIVANMSQEKLADALNVTFQQVQKYEKGTNRISASRLQHIADALKLPVSWFFDEQPGGKHERKEGADIIERMLTAPHGIQLATSYLAIAHNRDRRIVADVAEALAARESVASKQVAA